MTEGQWQVARDHCPLPTAHSSGWLIHSWILSSSTSNRRVALGGLTRPAPRLPYPRLGEIKSSRLPPTFMLKTPSSQPLITRPVPIGKSNGSPRSTELSNFLPLAPFSQSQPV